MYVYYGCYLYSELFWGNNVVIMWPEDVLLNQYAVLCYTYLIFCTATMFS